ncbi:MAG: adenine nucleotide alpha hydrolase [Gammaproteobacteria bacterium]|nr:adenine nucleotide alpha hydrolase [Gammaproteobacteria bacterium]
MSKPKLLLSWSSGKDSAWTLHVLRAQDHYDVVGLVTTVNENFARVAMHGVREELLVAQADAAGVPLWRVPLPHPCPNTEYEKRMRALVKRATAAGVTHMAFGDLFLQDIRAYREKQLADTGIAPVFPLWGRKTMGLAREMVRAGLRAKLSCVDPRHLPREFAGRTFDDSLLDELPAGIDPCGENGEFHSFCCAGPMFRRPIAVQTGEVVERDGFVFADIVPG